MKKNFWQKLSKPFFCLAPLANVTDCAFRRIIAKYSRHGLSGGGPDVFWTEFVSADGLARDESREKLLPDLRYSEEERPIVAQIFGSDPENIRSAAVLCEGLGFDGVDINMGCPDRAVERQGAGAAMIKNPPLAREVVRAAREGADGLPVSVKTRLGYNKIEIGKWLPEILAENIATLTVHLRTRKEMSAVPAHWEVMPEIVAIRDKISPTTLVIGNGDVADIADGREKCARYGCDGVMLGRAIFGNPWLFDRGKRSCLGNPGRRDLEERLRALLEHTKLFEKMLGGIKNFDIMKKHFKAYVSGFDGAKELRMKLMETKNASEVEKIIHESKLA